MFNPLQNLLQTERSIEGLVGFRLEMAYRNLQMMKDLLMEEINRTGQEVNTTLASLHVLYDTEDAAEYDIQEAIRAMYVFMRRTQDTEESKPQKNWNSMSRSPKAALYKNMPAAAYIPPEARMVNLTCPQNGPQTSSAQNDFSTGKKTNSTTRNQRYTGP